MYIADITANVASRSSSWCCSMKTGLMLQLALPVVLLAGLSEEFFFDYPRKLTEFFQSLKAKTKTSPKTNVQHYTHIHYYPMPFPLLPWTRTPDKYYLDELYGDTLASFGWSDYHYRYPLDPSLIVSSDILSESDVWDDLWNEEILGTNDAPDTIDRNSKGILVQVPVNRQFVFHLPLKKSRQRHPEMATT